MKADSNTTQTKISLMLILVFVVISIIALQQYQSRFSINTNSSDKASNHSSNQFSKIFSPSTFFTTEIFLDRDNTFISIPFDFSQKVPDYPIWLLLQTNPEIPNIESLAFHPQLNQLDWPSISNKRLTLFQKSPQYQTVEEFLNSPPTDATILADSQLIETSLPELQNTIKISETLNLDQADFILTTFRPLRSEKPPIFYYETTIDATNARVDDNQELNWQLRGDQVSEDNPFYIGEIHIDYRLE